MMHRLPRYLRRKPFPRGATESERALISTFAEKGYAVVDIDTDAPPDIDTDADYRRLLELLE